MIQREVSNDRGTPRLTQPPDAMLNTTVAGKYKILKKLGEGGMGSVYMAQQMPIDRMVAVKVLLGKLAQDEVAVKRFEQEARAVSKMQHPNTVTIYDYGKTEDDRLYIVMEFLKGKTLSEALRGSVASGGMDPKRVVRIATQVCSSLADAHNAGIIHRDLKPDNIFLTEVGGAKDWVKVLDFGVAKLADNEAGATLTQTGMIFGTPKYMSPEQAEGRPIDYRADIYAIGVVLFEMLTGRPPFLAETPVALLLKHISEPPPPFRKIRPDIAVPAELEAVVMKALEKNPDKRHMRVDDLAADLEACLRILTTGPTSIPVSMGTHPVGTPRAIPTEVSPLAQPLGDLSPGGLMPPAHVPSGISLGAPDVRRMPTEPAPPNIAQDGPRTGATRPADVQLRHHPDAMTAAQGTAPGGATRPIPGTGPGIETLGGMPGIDVSGPLRAKTPQKSRWPLFAGAGAAVVALAVIIGVSASQRDSNVATAIDLPQVEDPKRVESPKAAVATPAPPPAETEKPPVAPSPAVQEKAPVASDSARPKTKSRDPRAADPVPVASKKVSVSFTSEPAGAIVVLEGSQIGKTPFTREFVRGTDMVSVEFKLSGYEEKRQIFTLTEDRTVRAELRKALAEVPVITEKVKPEDRVKPSDRVKPTDKVKPDTSALDERVSDLK